MSSLLGGNSHQSSASSSVSSNQAYPFLQGQLGGTVGQAGQAGGLISALLGAGGDPAAAAQGMDAYKKSSGYQFQLDQGTQAINDNAASRGLLQSGATAKALAQYGTGLANQNFNGYLQNLLSLGNQGIAAGGVLANSGQTTQASSNSNGKSKTGLGI